MNPLLIEGLSDAIGFVTGAWLAYGAARLFGLDPLVEGYSAPAVVGIAIVGLGGGIGLHLAKRWRVKQKKTNS